MLPSTALFSAIDCPLLRASRCDRPFCKYKHEEQTPSSSQIANIPCPGGHSLTPVNGTLNSKEDSDACLLELERINKEIETVMGEVEKEKERLTRYQSAHGNGVRSCSEKRPIPREVLPSHQKEKKLKHTKSVVSHSSVSKYVVDHSRPKTDLEYDPCSNYSADLLSNTSMECKTRVFDRVDIEREHNLKRKGDQIKLLSDKDDDDDGDGVLVIDIPPLENDSKQDGPPKRKRKRNQMENSEGVVNVDEDKQKRNRPRRSFTTLQTASSKQTPFQEKRRLKKLCKTANSRGPGSPERDLVIDVSPPESSLEKHTGRCKEPTDSPEKAILLNTADGNRSQERPSKQSGATTKGPQSSESDLLTDTSPVENQEKKQRYPQRSEVTSTATPEPPQRDLVIDAPTLNNEGNLEECAEQCSLATKESLTSDGARTPSLVTDAVATTPFRQPETQLTSSQSGNLEGRRHLLHGEDNAPNMENVLSDISICLNNLRRESEKIGRLQEVSPIPAKKDNLSGPATPAPPVVEASNNPVIQIDSDSEELNYSDLDISDTDPMEECYNIFMEANKSSGSIVQDDTTHLPEVEVKPNQPPSLKKRVAHVAKFEVNKNKAQAYVPLRGAVPQVANPSRIQQCQRRANALTGAVKGGQSFLGANGPQKVYTHPIALPNAVQNSCLNIIPVGATLQLGPNLHLIVPEGSCAMPVTLVPSTVAMSRPMQPLPPPQPSPPPGFTPPKPVATKRKVKTRPEVVAKVPHDTRQRYVNLFVEEFLKTSGTVQDAFEKALAEEKTLYDRSVNKLKYLSVAVNTLKKLKNQNTHSAKASAEGAAQGSRGSVALSTEALVGNGDTTLYEQLKEYILSEQMLRENNFPLKHPEKTGVAVQYGAVKKAISDPLKRICCRCGSTFSVSQTGKHTRKEECTYHYGKVIENKVPGGVETRYSCCESAVGTSGCQVFKLHVHDSVSLQGFVSTLPPPSPGATCPGVYALDCETCFTTQGVELVRVSVVSSSLQVIYDTFVWPENDLIDLNTRFSGVSEDDVKGCSVSLRDVQAALLSFVNEDTILIGHGLENDLCALKLLHRTVVDTSVVFPHRLGLPHRRELHSLTADHLRRIIQDSAEGHDSREDAKACMELILWRVKEDAKVRRW
ncbi:RNA exonuclease 1 homolog [Chanos chanos]|uniref:RNA exonuclease 1 homolog n=1 Tax=Chanos chanos TaxID=29144 RepID=A0A6J2WLC7_CHACN|nr:RNA exonuclease 1 homolog [Chanos chanos]